MRQTVLGKQLEEVVDDFQKTEEPLAQNGPIPRRADDSSALRRPSKKLSDSTLGVYGSIVPKFTWVHFRFWVRLKSQTFCCALQSVLPFPTRPRNLLHKWLLVKTLLVPRVMATEMRISTSKASHLACHCYRTSIWRSESRKESYRISNLPLLVLYGKW